MEKIASLQVVFYLNIPMPKLPDLFYDPRSLSEDQQQRSSLHAKCIIIDRKIALVSSANFTEAAQTRNIEAVVVRYEPFVERLANYFEGLQKSGHFSKLVA
ncbi:MAG: phospholipase D-like domain-containing protein [Blastocatellia bacterium]